jgi:hypothetical protein
MTEATPNSEQVYILATPVTGNLEVHVKDCQHIHRLWLGGGGAISAGTLEEMIAQAIEEVDRPPKIASCVQKTPKTEVAD